MIQAPTLGALNSSVGIWGYSDESVNGIGLTNYPATSVPLQRLVLRVFTTGDILYPPSPCGSNCSYTISFDGPAYDCIQADPNAPHPVGAQIGSLNPGLFVYNTSGPTTPDAEDIWFFYGTPSTQNYTLPWNPDQIVHCTLYNASYYTKWQFSNNIPSVSTDIERHDKINVTAVEQFWTIQGNRGPFPVEGWVMQQTNYYAVEQALVNLLQGMINIGVKYTTQISMSPFVDISNNNATFPTNFPEIIKDMLTNVTLSLPYLLQNPTLDVPQSARYVSVNATLWLDPAIFAYSFSMLWGI